MGVDRVSVGGGVEAPWPPTTGPASTITCGNASAAEPAGTMPEVASAAAGRRHHLSASDVLGANRLTSRRLEPLAPPLAAPGHRPKFGSPRYPTQTGHLFISLQLKFAKRHEM